MSVLSRWWFRTLTNNFLVYNCCWEDPAIDKQLLKLDHQSRILMITSAGDNALSYLLEEPASIDCVDINPRQNALLEFKTLLFRTGNYELLSALFVAGKTPYSRDIYHCMRPHLSENAAAFWDYMIGCFKPGGKGFYYSALSGRFALILKEFIRAKKLSGLIHELIHAPQAEQRQKLYERIRKKLWSGPSGKLWQWPGLLSLGGIPYEQKVAIGNMNDFMDRVFRTVFVRQSARHNYFWRLYLNGYYTEEYRPDYLMRPHFDQIRSGVDRVSAHTGSVSAYLSRTQKRFSHFVLLDHMDWLASSDPGELHREWKQIFRHAEEGATVLFRSAWAKPDFLPEWVLNRLEFFPIEPGVLEKDRVGTYPGTFLASIRHV